MEELKAGNLSFGPYEIDRAKRRLLRNGETLPLNSKTFDLLLFFAENHGRLLSKDEILSNVWPDQFVEENNLSVQVSALRKAFGERQGGEKFITTVPGKGYCFVADVRQHPDDEELVIEQHSISRVVIDEELFVDASGVARTEDAGPTNEPAPVSRTGFRYAALISLLIIAGLTAIAFTYWNRPIEKTNGSIEFSRLTTNGIVTAAAITPDGKYAVIAQTEAEGESLWLQQVASGSRQQIVPTRPVRYVGLAFSPDSDQIYATTFSPDLADPQVWRMPMLGGPIETIAGISTGAAVSVSPDGKQLAFTESRSSQKQTQLLISNTDGSEKRILAVGIDGERSFPNFSANPVAWAPDGRSIACAIEEIKNGRQTRIVLIDPRDGSEKAVTNETWDNADHLAWLDNENLVVAGFSYLSASAQVWSVNIRSGTATKMTNDLSSYSWVSTSNGSVLSVKQNPVSYISTIDLDADGKIARTRDVHKESGIIESVAYAIDGSIIFTSTANDRREIWRINDDGSEPTQLTVNANATFGMSVSPADGSIVFSSNDDGKNRLKRVNADGGGMRTLTDGPEDVYPSFTPDGASIVFQEGLVNRVVAMKRLAFSDGSVTGIGPGFAVRPAVSPDGSQVAFYFMDSDLDGLWRIGIASVVDGSIVGKISFPKYVVERRMRWHPNGRYISQVVGEDEEIGLIMLATDGTASRTMTGLGKGEAAWFEWSRDGKQIVLARIEKTRDAVVLARQSE